MLRKSAPLLHLLHLVLKPLLEQDSAPSNHHVTLQQQPQPTDRDAWGVHWQAQGQHWRTEPEIDRERQAYLAERRSILPDIEHGIYPFKGVKLNRADIEWLLATHEDGRGPVNWSDESQHRRLGIDVRGADLCRTDLSFLPLVRMQSSLSWTERNNATLEQRTMAAARMEGVGLNYAHLERARLHDIHLEDADLGRALLDGADLRGAYLDRAKLSFAHLKGAYLRGASLKGTDLRDAFLEGARLNDVILSNEKGVGPLVGDAHWDDVNVAVVQWSQIHLLGDEYEARRKTHDGKIKDKATQLDEHKRAVRANRQLALVLLNQGLNEDAARFAYRSQVLQKRVFWFQTLQKGAKPRQRAQALGAWLFSWFLFSLAGYGYRLWRSFLAYALVIIGFTTVYYLLGASFKPPLSLVNALGLSMTSFHGRGFFPGVTQLNDTLTILASLEAFVGLILEATFIATLTQRFFGK